MTRTNSLATSACKLAMATALFALPLGPFAWADAWAATTNETGTAAKAADGQEATWSFEYPLNDHIAMGQMLSITAKLPVPAEETKPETPATPATGEAASKDAATSTATDPVYTGTLQYETYGTTTETKTLATATSVKENGYYVVSLRVKVTPSSDAVATNSGWAEQARTRFTVTIADATGLPVASEVRYITIEPAYQTVFFDTSVGAGDIDQPKLDTKSVKATYGCTYSYDPEATTTTGATRTLPVPTRPNYDFAGWYTSYDAKTGAYGLKVDESTVFTGTSNQTLYAKWTGKKYEVRLSHKSLTGSNIGSFNKDFLSVTYGGDLKALDSVTGTGLTGNNTELRGWVDSDGNPVASTDKVLDTDANNRTWRFGTVILYPVWGEARTSIENAVVSGVEKTYPYTGKEIAAPALKVTLPESKDEKTGEVIAARELVAGEDYTVEYKDNKEISTSASKAKITVKGAGKYKGSVETSFEIVTGTPYFEVEKKDTTSAEHFDFDFNGSGSTSIASKLVTDAKDITYKLAEPVDGVSIDEKTGNLTVTRPVDGVKVVATAAKGTKFDATPADGVFYTFSVKQSALAAANVTLSSSALAYTGKKQAPKVTVKNAAGKVLAKGVDYTVKLASGCTKVGTYKVAVTGLNGYKDGVTKSFTIVPKTSSKVTAKRYGSTKSKGKSYGLYTLSWKKVSGASGYQVYRTVSSKTAKSTFGAKTTSKKFGWEKGKKVTVKVRAYQKASGKKYYSAWKTISVKAK